MEHALMFISTILWLAFGLIILSVGVITILVVNGFDSPRRSDHITAFVLTVVGFLITYYSVNAL